MRGIDARAAHALGRFCRAPACNWRRPVMFGQVLDGSAGISNLLMICFARSIGHEFVANRTQR